MERKNNDSKKSVNFVRKMMVCFSITNSYFDQVRMNYFLIIPFLYNISRIAMRFSSIDLCSESRMTSGLSGSSYGEFIPVN